MSRRGDIDAIRRAIVPRVNQGPVAVVEAASTTVPPHSHAASSISAEPFGLLAGDDVEEQLYELDAEKLARDGTQAMTGALNFGHFSAVDIDDADIEGTATVAENIVLTGAAGAAQIQDPRVILFEDSVVPGADYTAASGAVSWDATTLLSQIVQHADSDSGLVRLPGLGVYLKIENASGGLIEARTVVRSTGGSGEHVAVAVLDGDADGAINAHEALGLTLHDIAVDESGWVCCHGLALGLDTTGLTEGVRLIWLSGALSPASILAVGDPLVYVGHTVVSGASGAIWVDLDWRPKLDDLSNADMEGKSTYDVAMWHADGSESSDLWRPMPASYFPVTEVTDSTYEVGPKDAVLHIVAPCVVTLPDPSATGGLRRLSIAYAGGTGTVDLYCATYGIHGEETFRLVRIGETLTVQSVVTSAATTWVVQ